MLAPMAARTAVLFALIAALAIAALIAGRWFVALPHAPLEGPFEAIEVGPGDTAFSVGSRLAARGQLAMPLWAWRAHVRLRPSSVIQAGEYAIVSGMSAADLLDAMQRGNVIMRSVRLLEGSTFAEVRATLATAPRLQQKIAGLSDQEVMARLGRAGLHPEGRFFPDTYRYSARDADLDVLRAAAERMDRELARLWRDRDPNVPYANAEEGLILASLIEKETGRDDERRRIAGVFARRLALGMRLQTDPAIIYGLGDAFDGDLTRADLRSDQPYNTYIRKGLPPTPICMPSLASLAAAFSPEPGSALYFVARGDGSSEFSDTLAEHNEAVRRFQLARSAGK